MNKKDRIDDLIASFYREKNKRPLPDGFAHKLMTRTREESVEDVHDPLRDNLWIILMAAILVVLVAVVLLAPFLFIAWKKAIMRFRLSGE